MSAPAAKIRSPPHTTTAPGGSTVRASADPAAGAAPRRTGRWPWAGRAGPGPPRRGGAGRSRTRHRPPVCALPATRWADPTRLLGRRLAYGSQSVRARPLRRTASAKPLACRHPLRPASPAGPPAPGAAPGPSAAWPALLEQPGVGKVTAGGRPPRPTARRAPSPVAATVSTTGGRQSPTAERSSICSRSRRASRTPGAIGLVDHEQVGHLQQAGLVGLHGVAPPGGHHHHRGVGGRGHLDLHLPDAHRLDQHQGCRPRPAPGRRRARPGPGRPGGPGWPSSG